MEILGIERRDEQPDHPYWDLVDKAAEFWEREGEGEGLTPLEAKEGEAALDHERQTRFPECPSEQFSSDVELTILDRLRLA